MDPAIDSVSLSHAMTATEPTDHDRDVTERLVRSARADRAGPVSLAERWNRFRRADTFPDGAQPLDRPTDAEGVELGSGT